jgi:hypothetical protein
MALDNLHEHWDILSRDLLRAYRFAEACLNDEQGSLFFEYLEHNELGLAYELLCEKLAQERVKIAPDVYELLRSMGLRMELSPSTWEVISVNELK